MSFPKLKYYLVLIRRHYKYDGWKQSLTFAWDHKAFWNGATQGDEEYIHLRKGSSHGSNDNTDSSSSDRDTG